jgi:mono/diheme cytochrome c family protein
MPFPPFTVPYLGNGMTIALDAVLHVLISHGFAIGVVSMIVLAEYLGWRRQSAEWEKFARDLLGFALIIIMAVGAILGVGIWLVTSALEPRGIASLLRVFFWPWFIEWFAFTGEVIVILAYYFTWSRWTGPRKLAHIRLGAGYMFFGVMSAVLITGILGFMLTPDGWPWGRSFFPAFFNPTFLPQLLLRLSAAYTMGAVFSSAFLLFTSRAPAFRREALRVLGSIMLLGTVVAAGMATWYFLAVPSRFKAHAIFSVLTSYLSQHPEVFWIANVAGALLLLALGLAAVRRSPALARVLAIPAILACVGFVSEFERMREFIRGPYIMPGYMFANQVLLSESPLFQQNGMLPAAYWYNAVQGTAAQPASPLSQGAYLFGQNCAVCHTIGGVNNIATRVKGRSQDGIYVIIAHTHQMVPFMPPFSGTSAEQQALAAYLYQIANPAATTGGSSGSVVGAPSRFINLP